MLEWNTEYEQTVTEMEMTNKINTFRYTSMEWHG